MTHEPPNPNNPNNQVDLLKSHLLFLEAENQALALRLQQVCRQLEESRAELRSVHVMHNALLTRVAPMAPWTLQGRFPQGPHQSLYAVPDMVRMCLSTARCATPCRPQASSSPALLFTLPKPPAVASLVGSASKQCAMSGSSQGTDLLFDEAIGSSVYVTEPTDLLFGDRNAYPDSELTLQQH